MEKHRKQAMDTARGEERVRGTESNMETFNNIWKIDSQWEFTVMSQGTPTGALSQPRGLGWRGRWEAQEGGNICTPMADSC